MPSQLCRKRLCMKSHYTKDPYIREKTTMQQTYRQSPSPPRSLGLHRKETYMGLQRKETYTCMHIYIHTIKLTFVEFKQLSHSKTCAIWHFRPAKIPRFCSLLNLLYRITFEVTLRILSPLSSLTARRARLNAASQTASQHYTSLHRFDTLNGCHVGSA